MVDAAIRLSSNDPAAAAWVGEFLGPEMTTGGGADAPRIELASSAERYADLAARVPAEARPRPCFAFDRRVLSLPAWEAENGPRVADLERDCLLDLEPGAAELIGDPRSRRWRFTLVLVIHELIATRMRRTGLELHAAAVESGGRAILAIGPKGAGKTTLALHLLRAGGCRWLANDRVLAGPATEGIDVLGMPSAVKVRPGTAAELPELGAAAPPVERPYLWSLSEGGTPPPMRLGRSRGEGPVDADPGELQLSPAQVAAALGVECLSRARLGVLVFPEVDTTIRGWRVEPAGAGRDGELALVERLRRGHPAAPGDAVRADRGRPGRALP